MLTAASAAASYSAVPSSKLCLGCRRDASPATSCGTPRGGFRRQRRQPKGGLGEHAVLEQCDSSGSGLQRHGAPHQRAALEPAQLCRHSQTPVYAPGCVSDLCCVRVGDRECAGKEQRCPNMCLTRPRWSSYLPSAAKHHVTLTSGPRQAQ